MVRLAIGFVTLVLATTLGACSGKTERGGGGAGGEA